MIDAKLDPAGAIEEIEFLGTRLGAADLREALNRLLVIGMTRALGHTRKSFGHNALSPRQEDRVVNDFLLNVCAQFRHAVGAKTLQRDRTTNPILSAGALPAERGSGDPVAVPPGGSLVLTARRAPSHPGAPSP